MFAVASQKNGEKMDEKSIYWYVNVYLFTILLNAKSCSINLVQFHQDSERTG